MAKTPKRAPKGRKPSAVLVGTASGPLTVEVWITDPDYTVDALADDIKYQRVWTEGEPDAQGWQTFVFSADGPEGDPWQIGKIRIGIDRSNLDRRLQNLSDVKVNRTSMS